MEDPLLELSKLALLANPKERDLIKLKKIIGSSNNLNNNDPIRCICKSNQNNVSLIKCEKCKCLLHESCIDPSLRIIPFICSFCQSESSIYLEKNNISLSNLHQNIFNIKIKNKEPNLMEAFESVANSGNRTLLISNWLKNLTSRNDLYQNIHRSATKCMKRSSSTSLIVDLDNERVQIENLSKNIQNIYNNFQNIDTPLLDALSHQFLTQLPTKDFPKYAQINFLNNIENKSTDEELLEE